MNKLIQIARELTKKGDDYLSHHGPLKFHEKAQSLLLEANLHKVYQFEDLVKATFSDDFTTNQNYASFQFSDLPVTISRGQHCFLDLYFWRRRPTVIHDHHFTGAFQCLEGHNVDLEFEFVKSKKLGPYHDLGEVKLLKERILTSGDIAPIDLLDKFIHQNHHQADLTVNVCFRTPDIGATNLSNYLYSGLRFEKHPELLNRVNRLLSFINIGKFNLNELDLNLDDAINFMIRTYKSESRSGKFLETRAYLRNIVIEQTGLDIDRLMDQHEIKMDDLENLYN